MHTLQIGKMTTNISVIFINIWTCNVGLAGECILLLNPDFFWPGVACKNQLRLLGTVFFNKQDDIPVVHTASKPIERFLKSCCTILISCVHV